MYQNDPMKSLTGEVRLSYVSVVTPRVPPQGGEPKYSVTLLIPKSDVATKADIDACIQAAIVEAQGKTWGGQRPAILGTPIFPGRDFPKHGIPLYDGDSVRVKGEAFGEECKGHWVITASTKMKPDAVDMSGISLLPTDIYSGMYGRVTIRFFGYSNGGNKGIGCGLGNILKTRDGEPLAGNASAASDFAGITQAHAGAAMPATPYTATPGYAPPAPGYQPPPPGYPAQPAAPPAGYPAQHQVNINPLTGQPI